MKVVFNGVEYDGIDQMPPEIRSQYLRLVGTLGDADGNGIPDVLERAAPSSVAVQESIIYNGRAYSDRSELPPEVREALERMPPPKPGEVQSLVEVSTKVFPIKATVTVRESAGEGRKTPAWWIVTALSLIVLVLLFLWLSGIRPADLWRR